MDPNAAVMNPKTTDTSSPNPPDEAAAKGAVEDGRDTSLSGQLGHRDEDGLLKDNDTDFPEPDAEGEHSGESA
jgi:hypothetical protein